MSEHGLVYMFKDVSDLLKFVGNFFKNGGKNYSMHYVLGKMVN